MCGTFRFSSHQIVKQGACSFACTAQLLALQALLFSFFSSHQIVTQRACNSACTAPLLACVTVVFVFVFVSPDSDARSV